MGVVCGLKELNPCFPSYDIKNGNPEIKNRRKNRKHVIWNNDIRHHQKQMGELKIVALGCGAQA